MRSGWPHTEDGRGMTPASQGHVPFGPDVSWPGGYSVGARERRLPLSGNAGAAAAAAGQGAHPYAAFGGAGYGDDGYTDPGYQGPAAQDAGIAGTRTVRGFVESGQTSRATRRPATPSPGTRSHLPARTASRDTRDPATPGGRIEMAYPQAASASHGATSTASRGTTTSRSVTRAKTTPTPPGRLPSQAGGYGEQRYGSQGNDGAVRYQPPAFDPAAYNGSDYSMPGDQRPWLRPVGHHRHQRLRGDRLRRAELRAPLLRRPPVRRRAALPAVRAALRRDPLRRAAVRRDPPRQPVAGRGRRPARGQPRRVRE